MAQSSAKKLIISLIVCVEFFFCKFRQNKHTCRFKIIVQFPSISDTCVRLSFNSTDRHLSIHFEKAEHHNLTNKNIYWVQYRSDFCFQLILLFFYICPLKTSITNLYCKIHDTMLDGDHEK